MPAARTRSARARPAAATISPSPSSETICCRPSVVIWVGGTSMDELLRVLIVDDDPLQLDLIARRLRVEGFEVATSTSSFGTSNLIRTFAPKVVLLDVNIPALAGDKLLGVARRVAPRGTRFVLYSAC